MPMGVLETKAGELYCVGRSFVTVRGGRREGKGQLPNRKVVTCVSESTSSPFDRLFLKLERRRLRITSLTPTGIP